MRLSDLLGYKEITIQCHDNPDADAIASGFAALLYFKSKGQKARLVYCGRNRIQKTNLVLMIDKLQIPVEYIEDNTVHINGLLLNVDCQYGESNVTKLVADDYAIIDHHRQYVDNISKTRIESDKGSCSTILWEMLKEEKFDFSEMKNLHTALYYGLYTDTSQFTDVSNPVDKDMRDDLDVNLDVVRLLLNSNINAKELEIAGIALIRNYINVKLRYGVVKAEPCDPNILGLISDMFLQVSEIDKCIVFCVFDNGIKFSVRSCVKEHRANHIAEFVSTGIGSGGGHDNKAGGFISRHEYKEVYGDMDESVFFSSKLGEYVNNYDIIYAGATEYDTTDVPIYRKKRLKVGYIKATDIIDVGKEVLIRTLEGDINIKITNDLYIMIGYKGEVYPISEEQFFKSYELAENEKYEMTLQYHPKAKISDNKNEYSLLDYAKVCYSNGGSRIYAKKLDKAAKVFTRWDPESYTIGEAGDYLAAQVDNLQDIYIIEDDTFYKTYDKE